jgi:hypothetical protein
LPGKRPQLTTAESGNGPAAQCARRRLPEVDRARAQYVRRLYRADIDDPELFHLQIDSTVVPLEACAEVIVTAYRDSFDRERAPGPAGTAGTAGPAGCASGKEGPGPGA